MRLGLRRKYFLWLMLLTLLCTFFTYVADLAHDVRSGEFDGPGAHLNLRDESQELVFFLAASALVMSLTAAVGWLIARRLAQPIVDLAHYARTLDGSATGLIRPPKDGGDELEDIAASLTEAFRRYDTLLTSARRFNAHAAHQLRAPLAALRTVGECALSRPTTVEAAQETLALMLERTDQMTRMVNRLLAYSELSLGHCRQDFATVDVADVVAQVCDVFRPLAEVKEVSLVAQAVSLCTVRGSFVLLVEMLGNLVDNAIRFTPEGGTVQVSARPEASRWVQLVVADSGAGMSPAQRERVLDGLRHQAGARPAGGGLGLAIAAEIATLHEATIMIQPGAETGTTISIEIPALASPAHRDRGRDSTGSPS